MTKKKWTSFTLRVTITLLLFAFLFKSLSWSTLLAALARADHMFIFLSLPIGALGLLVSAYQWQRLLHGEQIRVHLPRLIKLYLIGTAFSHFLPTGMGGDVVKAFYVGRASDNYAGSASAVVMTRVTGFFGMQLVAFTALLLWHDHFQPQFILLALLLSLLVGGMIGGVVLLTAVLPRMVNKSWAQHRLFASIIPVGNALLAAITRPRLLASSTLIGVVFWILSTVNYYVYAQALHIHLPFNFYLLAIPVVSLVAFLPLTINGFGLRESAFVSIFATMHIPAASSLLLALIMDVQVLFFGTIGGILYLTQPRHDRAIKLQKPASSHIWRSTASQHTNIIWFTQEEQNVFDSEALAFDDSTPTLPLLLVQARTAKKSQNTLNPGQHPGKYKRVTLIRKETNIHVPTIDGEIASSAMETESFQADKFVSRGL